MRISQRFASALFGALALCPLAAWGQAGGDAGRNVGVVTTLAGQATVARAALASPVPLRFKDDVFLRDRIATAERSVVRVLLGGKALVTVRELSTLTVTEDTGRSTVDLTAGKIAMGVLRQRMRPGEVIEIRTPNAIAAIRGTVLVVELIPEPGGTPGAPRYTTKVHVLHGLVDVSDPKNPGAPPAQVGAMQSWSRTGSDTSSLVPLTAAAAQQVFVGLHAAPQIAESPHEFIQHVTAREQAKAVAVAEFLAPAAAGAGAGGDSAAPAGMSSPTAPVGSGITDAPVIPVVSSTNASAPPAGGAASPPTGSAASPPTGLAQIIYNGQTVTSPGSLYTLSGSQQDSLAVPILEAAGSSLSIAQQLVQISGAAAFTSSGSTPLLYLDPTTLTATSLLSLDGGATASLAGALFQDVDGVLTLRADFLRLTGSGRLLGTGAAALVDLAGTRAAAAGSVLAMSNSAVLDLISASAPLLSMTRSAALATGSNLADISGGATVRLGQLAALTGSTLTVQGHALSLAGSATMTVRGDLFRLAGGSAMTITNGALLSLSGSSILNVAGALVNFIGTGNSLSITNNLCAAGGCTLVGNIPVLVTGGATLSLGNNPFPNLGQSQNTLTLSPNAAVISVSGAAQVKQGP
jgi:FecR protein